jgi:hypothetical protein
LYVGGKCGHVTVRIEHRAPSITGCLGEDLLLTALKRHKAEEIYAVTSSMICTPYQKHYCNEVKMYGRGSGRAGMWDSDGREGKCTVLAERDSLED